MDNRHAAAIAAELKIKEEQVRQTGELIEEGCSVPFIARYRKEATGSLDEVAVLSIRDRLVQMEELDKRRSAILKSLSERELLTEDLEKAVMSASNMTALEDIYLPYRPKRRTRATIAVEKGLEELAILLMKSASGEFPLLDPLTEASRFINEEKGVFSVEDALGGARDIVAERVSEDKRTRSSLRAIFARNGRLTSRVNKGKEEKGPKYRDYFNLEEPARSAPSHRILAVFRGEKEGILSVSAQPPAELAIREMEKLFIREVNAASEEVRKAVIDGYARLAAPSMETELKNALKLKADREAIRVFAANAREVLMAPPLGCASIMAVDPGIRTGCKIVVLDEQGRLLIDDVIYPFSGKKAEDEAGRKVLDILGRHHVDAVAVGNGTAGRETEAFLKGLSLPGGPPVILVNESGASIYSASKAARDEFPDKDVTVRGSVSIGRRLQDPLSELVKIDPKSIGVGQYQHDVDQKMLMQSLEDVVVSCVNSVGVDLNTASPHLLSYVSGLGLSLAANIVSWRDSSGPFISRSQLLEVPRLGPKAYEQAAGFLRVRDGKNPLDASAVHPGHYGIVEKMVSDLKCSVEDLIRDEDLREKVDPSLYVCPEAGILTLRDIMTELAKPGRDPRKNFENVEFSPDVRNIEDLLPGMELAGMVTNVTAFGAFVDIGVHQDGLVHVSQLADRFVKNPADVVKPGQRVKVAVIEVDIARKRISLSMKKESRTSGDDTAR
ncbi:MAG: Tex family protein [Thermovirgaceae bacterium]|nr:Tex family protein [Thermovirgaceae bacterium]